VRRIVVTVLALAAILGIFAGMLGGPLAATNDALWPLSWIAWPIVGWVILDRRPGNRIGIACLAIGVVWGISFALESIVLGVPVTAAAWIELVYTVLGVTPWLIIVWLLTTFPTGDYQGRLERFVGRAVFVVGGVAMTAFLLGPVPLDDTGLENPMAQPALEELTVITNESGFFLVVALAAIAIVSVVLRGRRSNGIEKQQYRWLLLGGTLFLVISALGQFLPEDSTGELLWLLGGSAIPISIGVALVRYRLFEIDRLISRTVSYTLVIALMAALFFGTVTAVTSLLDTESDLVVAGATLAVAAVFNPVRRRIQGWVDRRFNRAHYDAARVMDRFAGSLRGRVEGEDVIGGWVGVVSETMEPSVVGVWVKGAT
jgi:hypothetical protein